MTELATITTGDVSIMDPAVVQVGGVTSDVQSPPPRSTSGIKEIEVVVLPVSVYGRKLNPYFF